MAGNSPGPSSDGASNDRQADQRGGPSEIPFHAAEAAGALFRLVGSLVPHLEELAGAQVEPRMPLAASPALIENAPIEIAKRELANRRARHRFFPTELFGEASWNMLLSVFIWQQSGQSRTVSWACHESDVPATTALRHIDRLIELGLFVRETNFQDRRSTLLKLTPAGMQTMEKWARSRRVGIGGPTGI